MNCLHGISKQHDPGSYTEITVNTCPFCEIEALQEYLQDSKTNEQYYYNLWEAAEKRIVEVKKALYDTIRIHLVDDDDGCDPEAKTLKIVDRILKEAGR